MPGIKDIAKRANCSISTVSYALNGSSKVTEATRQRILAIAKELDYVPNGAARMLRAQETKIIGCYLSDYSGSFYGRLLKGIREQLKESGYELIVCSGNGSRRLLMEKMMDGAIILDASFNNEDLLSIADLGHKMILLDRELSHENITTLLLDNKKGATLAIEALSKHEIEHIYIVNGPAGSFDGSERTYRAIEYLYEQNKIPFTLLDGDFTKEAGSAAAEYIQTKNHKKPIGVFCLNDEMAIGIYDFVKDTKLIIGKDIYMVGFDNTELASYIRPTLTTIDYSTTKWGRIASSKLLDLIKGNFIENEKIPVSLKTGESC